MSSSGAQLIDITYKTINKFINNQHIFNNAQKKSDGYYQGVVLDIYDDIRFELMKKNIDIKDDLTTVIYNIIMDMKNKNLSK
ncbi:MAG: hypothetical protein MR765_02355 [Tenericutes bacterium]|nr:hypothetical protein [Mycoplasmatota bacterium]